MAYIGEATGGEISIHALREEGDSHGLACMDGNADFYPRPPRGGRLVQCLLQFLPPGISIHALREEGDIRPASWPCGMRRFLSTPSARRATLMS